MNYEDLNTKGFSHFNDPEMFKYLKWYYRIPMIPFKSVSYPVLYWPVGKLLLLLTQRLLKNKYVPFDSIAGNVDAWKGIDEKTDVWHNDLIEGSNTAFLLYYFDSNKSTGGGIQIKNLLTNDVYTIYPKKHDILVMDQSLHYEHRVIPLLKPINRFTANIEFNILDFK